MVRKESFLSSAPFPRSRLCGCFCLKQTGLRVDAAAPVGEAASIAALGEERRSSGSSSLRLLARAAGWPHAQCLAGGWRGPRWPPSRRSAGTGTAAVPGGRSAAAGNLPASGAPPLDQTQPWSRPGKVIRSPVCNGLWKGKLNTVLMNLGGFMSTEPVFSVCCLIHKEF